MSASAQSNSLLQHLEDAEMVEFEIRGGKGQAMKYTTDGPAGWTPISITNHFSTRSDKYDVKYSRQCKQTRMYRLDGELAFNLDPPYSQHQL